MASKNAVPTWKLRGLDAPPEPVNGYHDYGVVYTAGQPSQRETRREAWDLCTWSWSYWGKKVRRDILAERAAGRHGTLAARAADLVALALVRFTAWLYRPRG